VWLCGYAKCEEISAFPGAKSFAMQPAAKGYINTFSFSLQTSRKRSENFSTRTLLQPPVSLRIFFLAKKNSAVPTNGFMFSAKLRIEPYMALKSVPNKPI